MHRKPSRPPAARSHRCGASPPAFLTRRAIAQRYGVSASTAARIVISEGFPAPTVINGEPYSKLSEIEAHEELRRRVRVVSGREARMSTKEGA